MTITVDNIEPEAYGDISIDFDGNTHNITLEQAKALANTLEFAIQEADTVKITPVESQPYYNYMAGRMIKT